VTSTGRVVVVGGGVSGLTVAYRLRGRASPPDVVVLEAESHVGGKLTTTTVGGLDLPAGPDSFVARKPWAVELCRELGLGDLVPPAESGAWLWTERGLVPYPTGTAFGIPGDVGDVIRWPGLTRRGRRRALLDLVKAKRRDDEDESLGSLLRRRLGDEATDRAIAPLLAGLHAGDVDRLSARATFPELQDWERSQGSLIRGAQATRKATDRGADPGPVFLRPREGVAALTDALARELGPAVRSGATVTGLTSGDGPGWIVRTDDDQHRRADAVVLAVPSAVAAGLLDPIAPAAAKELTAIRAVSTAAVLAVYAEGTGGSLPHGSGFVVPRGAAPMTACTWLSSKWPDPAFGSRAVLRCFVGADGEEDVLDADDEEIVLACARHLAAVLPLPEEPEQALVVRWPGAMPQYEVGHLDRVGRIRTELPPGVVVTGPSYDGVGVADCVRAAGDAAGAVVEHLRHPTTSERETIG
jgi:oxygen-dependent protoporphyrinogen oxidase